MSPAVRLTAAGFIATAVAFGPARMGFGLFLPAFREDFALSTSAAGLIASGGFLAFLVALLASAWLGRRYGQRLPVIVGALAATAGFVAVAGAQGAALLAAGIALSGASAGLSWAPFNDAAEKVLPDDARATALSVISTGTTVGVIVAAGLALAVTREAIDWRVAWIAFAGGGVALTAAAWAGLPASRRGAKPAVKAVADIIEASLPSVPDPDASPIAEGEAIPGAGPAKAAAPAPAPAAPDPAEPAARLARREALPLYGTALCFGMTNAIFLSFAADRVVGAGGLAGVADEAASTVIFFGYGVFGLLGLATGRIEARIGLAPLFFVIFLAGAASLLLIGFLPTSWAAVIAASGLHGMAIMMVSAVFSFWSLRLFPGRGTLGFTATLLSMATGSVVGPALGGLLSETLGPAAMFAAAAVPPGLTAVWFGLLLPNPRPRLPPSEDPRL